MKGQARQGKAGPGKARLEWRGRARLGGRRLGSAGLAWRPGSYVPTDEALTAPGTRNVVIQQAARDLAALRRKYRALIDFDAVLRQELHQDEAKAS